jgi:hypothetical protein
MGYNADAPAFMDANDPPVVDADAPAVQDTENAEVNRGGRPKGSTNENLRDAKHAKKLALNYAASEASLIKKHSESQGYERIPKGVYEKIVKKAESEFSLEEGSLNKQMSLTRVKRGKLSAAGRGCVSPMVALEAHFLDLILELASMR